LENRSENVAYLVALAWPEAWCRNAGSWYDSVLDWIGFSKAGYSPVGHAALMLVRFGSNEVEYYDCGRYCSVQNYACIRSAQSDDRLQIQQKAQIENGRILNLPEILAEIEKLPLVEEYGRVKSFVYPVDEKQADQAIAAEINAPMRKYGPFHPLAINCSRFVARVLRKAQGKSLLWYLRFFPSPSPGNLVNLGSTQILWKRLLLCSTRSLFPNRSLRGPLLPIRRKLS